MIRRICSDKVLSAAAGFPIVAITGPRQSGKTTLCRMIFADRPYVSFEDPGIRERFLEDPLGFLRNYEAGAVFDEAQRCPDLFSYLQGMVDGDRRMGRFILTGSAQFDLEAGISQSLAGRVATLELLPFCMQELSIGRDAALDDVLFRGCYPPVHDRDVPPELWFSGYVRNYIERDVRMLLQISHLDTFQRFVRLAAARTGQLLNLSELGNAAGVNHNTVKSWLSVMQASYLVYLARPFHMNISKRLVKSPKLYFLDPGLVCWLLSIQSPAQLNLHPMRGSIFETFVVAEILKKRFNALERDDFCFYRDHKGMEVDLILARGNDRIPVEIKSGMTFRKEHAAHVLRFREVDPGSAAPVIIYGGDERFSHAGCEVIPWRDLGHTPL